MYPGFLKLFSALILFSTRPCPFTGSKVTTRTHGADKNLLLVGCFYFSLYTFSSLKSQTSVSCPIFTAYESHIKHTVTCIRRKDIFINYFTQPTLVSLPKNTMICCISFFQPWKPETLWASLPLEAALADPGSALQLESLEKCGVKKACSVFL